MNNPAQEKPDQIKCSGIKGIHCNRWLPFTEEFFSKNSGRKWGMRSYCKECGKKYCAIVGAEKKNYWKNNSPFSGRKKKRCIDCHELKRCTKENWVGNWNCPDGLCQCCSKCNGVRALQRKYGINQEDKNKLHAAQGGKDPITYESITTNGDANVDHDHEIYDRVRDGANVLIEQKRSSVRGLLAWRSNILIGGLNKMSKDLNITSLELIQRIQEYEQSTLAQEVLCH
jgi:hypothetical protein